MPVDNETPEASKEQKHELQSVIGTLLYYSRTVDPSICTAVHALGSIQAKPTIKECKKWNDYFNTYLLIRIMESDIAHRTCSYKDNLTLPTKVDLERNRYVEAYSISVPGMP